MNSKKIKVHLNGNVMRSFDNAYWFKWLSLNELIEIINYHHHNCFVMRSFDNENWFKWLSVNEFLMIGIIIITITVS